MAENNNNNGNNKPERKILNGWSKTDEPQKAEIFKFCGEYIDFLNKGKTEREVVKETKRILDASGFYDIDSKTGLKAGDKVYRINKGKGVYVAVIGKDALKDGINMIGSHIDSPRLDLKQNPLYEDSNIALFKTHYYGGIKKYQWTAIPLAIHGVIVKETGEVVEVNIGEADSDPVFVVSDLLPHLSAKQNKKPLSEGVPAENLNIMIGSMPLDNEDNSSVKSNILALLNKKYGIREVDFNSAELEVVPAFKARTMGFDESMIASYGHDDRVCAYPCLRAILDIDQPEKTAVCILADKEEVGSNGNTGMCSMNFELFMMDILEKMGDVNPYSLQRMMSNSKCLSADVTAAFDPTYASVMEKNNAAYLGAGICFNKYTGARGKSGASDANAEFVAYVRGIFEKAGVMYQAAELGKVDEGGGGTIAYILANKGMDVLDAGVPVISMHSPYEVVSKYDVFMTFMGYKAFFKAS